MFEQVMRFRTPGEISRIKHYYNRFVILYNDVKCKEDIDAHKFCRMLNVEIGSFHASHPDECELIDQAVQMFKVAMEQLRWKANARLS